MSQVVIENPIITSPFDEGQSGIRGVVRVLNRVLDPGIAVLLRDLGDVDRGFKGFDLAEKQLLLAGGVSPVGKVFEI